MRFNNRSDADDLIAMRQGRISAAEYESRYGVTDVNDRRHAAWYAEQRGGIPRVSAPVPSAIAAEKRFEDLSDDEQMERCWAIAEQFIAEENAR